MGIVLLGMSAMNTQGMMGAVFQMFNHGTITAMLFLIVGVIYDRAHTRDLDAFGGLAITMPKYTGIMTVAFFAALGLPGLERIHIRGVLVPRGIPDISCPDDRGYTWHRPDCSLHALDPAEGIPRSAK